MDIREEIKAQIAATQAELQQHQEAQQNAAAAILQCMGAIRGLELLQRRLETSEKAAEETPKDAAPPTLPENDVDDHG